MHVLYVAPFALHTGYCQAATDYMLALHRAGVSLEIWPLVECDTDDLEERYAELLPLVIGYPGHETGPAPTHVIVHTPPGGAVSVLEGLNGVLLGGAKKILVTTWETSDFPAQLLIDIAAKYDSIIVPSEFCASVIPGDTIVIPHCFDPKHWPQGRTWNGSTYVFYSILGWSERKNPIGLLKAYLSEFSSRDDVVLRIHSSSYSHEDVGTLISRLGYDDLPALEIKTDYLNHEDLVNFHDEGHCFVTAARGEGWNLPAFEAALTGNPVIAPAFGGHLEYLQGYKRFLSIPYQLTPAITEPVLGQTMQVGGLTVRVANEVQPPGIDARQKWAEPDLAAMADTMRTVYEERWTKSAESRPYLEGHFSTSKVGAEFARVLRSL